MADHEASNAAGADHELLERDDERRLLEAALAAGGEHRGGLVVIRGEAGAGKTALLQVARDLARARGMFVLRARGAEFERGFPFGTARQLLEPVVSTATAVQRTRLFAGSASLARPLFAGRKDERPKDGEDQALALVEGLSWLIGNLAAEHPAGLLLAIDDAQSCDRASLRVLARTALRLDDIGVVIVITVRLGEAHVDEDLIAWLSGDPHAVVLDVPPLSEAAVHGLAERLLGGPADAEFSAACREATGGNPFLVGELLSALRADGAPPTADAADVVGRMVPAAVLRSVTTRVTRLDAEARRLAEAVAVLGPRASMHHAATLAGLSQAAAGRAAEGLAAAGLLADGHPLNFRHPLVAAAVRDELGALAGARAHGRAARLLAKDGAPAERVAAHLLAAPPAADSWSVEILRQAAADSLPRGGPECAVPLLKRALEEPPPAGLRGETVLELARAEAAAGVPAAADRLRSALELVRDPIERVAAMRELSRIQFIGEHYAEAAATVQGALTELGDDHPLVDELLVEYLACAGLCDATRDAAVRREAEARFARLAAETDAGSAPDQPALLVQLANALSVGRGPRAHVTALVERALEHGPLDELGPYGLAPTWAVCALSCVDELDVAEMIADSACAAAVRRGSMYSIGKATFGRALVSYERGLLERAAQEAATALGLAQSGVTSTLAWSAALLCAVQRERGDMAAARRAMEVAERTDHDAVTFGFVLQARACLALALDEPERAWADALAARDVLGRYRLTDYPLAPWRLPAAVAAHALACTDDARTLAEEELTLARAAAAPRPLGAALVIRASLATGGEALALLEEAVDVLAGSPANLV
ncbi:MAG: ATP-binding protein, partial [Chloroflexota bacterium]|nr:ATP-binding protein [Chloroflexota bacterium]